MATIGYSGFGKKIAEVKTRKYGAAFAAGKRTASREAASRATARKVSARKVSTGAKVDWFKKNLGISKGTAGNIGIGLMIAMMVQNMAKQGLGHRREMAMMDVQEEALQGGNMQDQYYAAALPELRAERQMAQQALMQMVMGGQGMPMMPMQVPGERVIGGAGGGY